MVASVTKEKGIDNVGARTNSKSYFLRD